MAAADTSVASAPPDVSPTRKFIRRFVRHPGAMVGLAIMLVLVLSTTFAEHITSYDPTMPDYQSRLQAPSAKHLFGTDEMGRDVFTRVLYGGKISLWVGFVSVAVGAGAGTVLGLVSGYYGGRLDNAMMRFMDMLMAMPSILLSLTIVFSLGASLPNIMLAVGVASIPQYARVVRGTVLAGRELTYVEAARALGASDLKVMFRHILPNVVAPVLVLATLGLAGAILSVAALNFLGLGVAPPTPEWGAIVSDGRERLRTAWWISTFPGLTIALAVLGINLLGDGLRDLLDPRLRGQ